MRVSPFFFYFQVASNGREVAAVAYREYFRALVFSEIGAVQNLGSGQNFAVSTGYSKYTKFRRFDGGP